MTLVGITGRFQQGTAELPAHLSRSLGANAYYVAYAHGMARAGAVPVFLPIGGDVAKYARKLDALVLSGGADVDPRRYGATPGPSSTVLEPERDNFEIELVKAMRLMGKPILGICRGAQLINVAFGGTLVADLKVGQGESHSFHGYPGSHRVHQVDLVQDSETQRIFGLPRVKVNSFHHQAVDIVAPAFKVSAKASDGVVEAIESEDGKIVAVQWHPEMFLEQPDPVFVWLARKSSTLPEIQETTPQGVLR